MDHSSFLNYPLENILVDSKDCDTDPTGSAYSEEGLGQLSL